MVKSIIAYVIERRRRVTASVYEPSWTTTFKLMLCLLQYLINKATMVYSCDLRMPVDLEIGTCMSRESSHDMSFIKSSRLCEEVDREVSHKNFNLYDGTAESI